MNYSRTKVNPPHPNIEVGEEVAHKDVVNDLEGDTTKERTDGSNCEGE